MSSKQSLKSSIIYSLSGIYIAGILASFILLFQSPHLGIETAWNPEDENWQVVRSTPDSLFYPGDAIRTINGTKIGYYHLLTGNDPIDTRAEFFSWIQTAKPVLKTLKNTSVNKVSVIRDNQIQLFNIKPSQAELSFFNSLSFLSIFIIAAVFFSIGIISFSRMPVNEQSLSFLSFCTAFAITLFTMSVSAVNTTHFIIFSPGFFAAVNVINLLFYFLSSVFLFHFTLLLPRKRRILYHKKWIMPVYYLVNFIISASFHLEIMFTLVPVYFLLSVITIIHAFFVYAAPVERQQMKWVAAGFLFGFGPWILLNGIPGLLFKEELMTDYIPGLFTVFIPLFMAFSIRKYKLMTINVLFEGTFIYGLTLVLLLFIDIGLLGLISTRFSHALDLSLSGRGVLSIAVIVLGYVVLRDRIQAGINRLFKKTRIDASSFLSRFNRKASGKTPEKILEILKQTILETFRPKKILIISKFDSESQAFLSDLGSPRPVPLWEETSGSLLQYPDMVVALPLFVHRKPAHLLLLGNLESGKLYSQYHLDLLNGILTQANLLYNNAILFADNIKQARARLIEEKRSIREKEKILKDLHDGIGGITSNIRLLAEMGKNSKSVSDTRKMFASISELSRESLFEIRSFFHSLDTHDTDWDEFISELNHFAENFLAPHHIEFQSDIKTPDKKTPCDSLLFLILFRIYKEGLANIVKHSKANKVEISFSLSDSALALVIRDNGSGIKGSRHGGRGLTNMQARARELGGTLTVQPDAGTTLALEVPLPVNYVVQEE